MTDHASPTPRLFGLVRDAHGRPKIDDPSTLHPAQVMMLTYDERVEMNIWPHALVVDAQGIKRATRNDDGELVAIDQIVAASVVFEDLNPHGARLSSRRDVPVNGVLKET